jgi:hypothetical protein
VGFIDVHNGVGPATFPAAEPGWTCGPFGSVSGCGTNGGLAAGAKADFKVEVSTNAAELRKHQCKVKNVAVIAVPVGAPKNTVAADDVSIAVANGPADLCGATAPMKQTFCPAERQMPDQGCCPEGQRWNGRECSGGKVTKKPVPKVCPKDTVGEYPNCRGVRTKKCPPNTKGSYPDCRPITVKVCPSDSFGKFPNCTCKRGTVGTPGECRKRTRQCPDGTTGKWPNCEQVIKRCPKNTVGKWPNCLQIRQKCPKGTAGTWPNCEKRPVTTGCPDGMVYSKRQQGCVKVETVPHVEPKLRSPTIRISPNKLNQQIEIPQ